jgi:hypothetical protein
MAAPDVVSRNWVRFTSCRRFTGESTLLFDDLVVQYGFHPSRPYNVQWSSFDNFTQNHNPIAGTGSSRLPHEVTQAIPGTYFSAVINASGDPQKTVTVYIHKKEHSYKIVGVDRTW